MSHKITIDKRVISILKNLSEKYAEHAERVREYDSESGLFSFYYGMVLGIIQAMAVINDHRSRKGGKK